jgi:hypothetical protein
MSEAATSDKVTVSDYQTKTSRRVNPLCHKPSRMTLDGALIVARLVAQFLTL